MSNFDHPFRAGPGDILPEEITLLRKIGEGCFGSVYEGVCRTVRVAVKIPNKQKLSQQGLEAFRKEVEIMSQINHPNVCLFMGAVTVPGSIRIVTELMQGDVETVMRTKKSTLSERLHWVKDAAQGMAWLHGNRPILIHRDLKTANLLMDGNGRVKVCDFGLAEFKEDGTAIWEKEPKGTPLYMAPEVMLKQQITEKVDVYAFGIVTWEILTIKEAFSHHSQYETFKNAICSKGERPPIPDDCLPRLAKLLTKCWDASPSARPPFTKIVSKMDNLINDAVKRERELTVASQLHDPIATQFWCSRFLSHDSIPWFQFIKAFYQHLKIAFPLAEMKKDDWDASGDDQSYILDEGTRKMFCLKSLAVEHVAGSAKKEELVSLENFGRLLGYFGPLEIPYKSGGFLDKIQELLQNRWFHGQINTKDAENKLKLLPRGAFLVRFSNTQANSYCISKVSSQKDEKQKVIKHIVVPYEDKKGYLLDGVYYPSLSKLIDDNSSKYYLKEKCEDTKYSWLFEDDTATVGGYAPDDH